MRCPHEDIQDGWDIFDEKAKEWYYRYYMATERGNFTILQELCDEAPSDKFEELKAEIIYERDCYKRAQYTLPKSRFPTYSEWDYSWSAPKKVKNKRDLIDRSYSTEATEENMRWVR